jgi:hypothetical protein
MSVCIFNGSTSQFGPHDDALPPCRINKTGRRHPSPACSFSRPPATYKLYTSLAIRNPASIVRENSGSSTFVILWESRNSRAKLAASVKPSRLTFSRIHLTICSSIIAISFPRFLFHSKLPSQWSKQQVSSSANTAVRLENYFAPESFIPIYHFCNRTIRHNNSAKSIENHRGFPLGNGGRPSLIGTKEGPKQGERLRKPPF